MHSELKIKHDRQIVLSARPIRYAYILGNEPTKKIIIKVISDCCEAFGGTHNIIIPSNGNDIDESWKQFLFSADPDVILLCGEFKDIAAIKSSISETYIQPFAVKSWHGEHARTQNIVQYSPLPVDKIYQNRLTEYTGLGKKAIVVVAPRRGKNINLINYFNYGMLSNRFISEFKQSTDFISPKKTANNTNRPLIHPTAICSEKLTHAEWEYIRAINDNSIIGPYIAVTGDPNSLEDCCLFWNWRALAPSGTFVQWIDRNVIGNLFSGKIFDQVILEFPPGAKLLTSHSLGKANTKPVTELLSTIQNYENNVKKYGFSYLHPSEYEDELANVEYFSARDTTSISNDDTFVINGMVLPPYNYEDCMFTDMAMDIKITSKMPMDKSGLIVTPNHDINDVLILEQRSVEAKCRVKGQSFTVLLPCSFSTGSISVKFNSDWQIISNYCKRKGVNIVESPSGKHIRRSIELAGTIEELASYYRNEVATAILSEFEIRHNSKLTISNRDRDIYRRSFSVKSLMATIIKNSPNISAYKKEKLKNEIDRLIKLWWQKGILVSGFELKCEECNFHTWYPIEMVGDNFICLRCQIQNKRPHNAEIQYRLQESFYQAHWENMMVPILTLDMLKSYITRESFIFSLPVYTKPLEVNSPEIDLIVISDGEIVVAECKKPNKLEEGVFTLYSEIARHILAHRILFSTITRKNTCENNDCKECVKLGVFHADEIFSHGIPDNPANYGTREKIKHFREEMLKEDILVETICAHNLGIA